MILEKKKKTKAEAHSSASVWVAYVHTARNVAASPAMRSCEFVQSLGIFMLLCAYEFMCVNFPAKNLCGKRGKGLKAKIIRARKEIYNSQRQGGWFSSEGETRTEEARFAL